MYTKQLLTRSLRRQKHTFTNVPSDLEKLPTHTLLQKLGFVSQSSSGIVHWLPLGLRVLNNITDIINKHMSPHSDQVSLSSLSSATLWKQTNRWDNPELFKLKDSKKAEYCLVGTCEEEITALVNDNVTSYKQLPLNYYQVSRKYRDEKRPRGGLLRGREFLMKDAYSFDADEVSAKATFNKMNEVYEAIFTELKVPFVAAWADSGAIGGDLSKEYHLLHESGEDTVMKCNSCGEVSNVEKTTSYGEATAERAEVKYMLDSEGALVALYYPEGRVLNDNLVKECLGDLEGGSNEEVLAKFQACDEDELMFKRIVRVMDCRVHDRTDLPDFPITKFQKNNFAQITDVTLVDAVAGETCGSCENGELEASRAIEVGHTFHLGEKYSKAMNASFVNEQDQKVFFNMGCYGIGVSRLVAAIAEVSRDKHGFNWPTSLAPYHVTLVEIGRESGLLKELTSVGISVVKDDSRLSLGKKLTQSRAIGIPLSVIVGKEYPTVEIQDRKGSYKVHIEEAPAKIKSLLEF